MTSPIYLMLVFHNHQPVGQFDYIVEHSTNVSYLPMIELLENHPTVKVGMHYSGPLLDWLKHHHQEIIERLRVLVQRGQVELISGGYYEPILPSLPDEDKVGQIQKLNEELHATFGAEPIGGWLAERVWEPHLTKFIAEANLRYVIVDDTHFEAVGFDPNDMFGYYITEEQGWNVGVFPTLTYLRYAIPWQSIDSVLDWLRDQSEASTNRQPRLALMSDDGEKFGTWPGTYQHCWGENKYMKALFTALEANADWIHTITPAEYLQQFPALGRAYLPSASYMEMSLWSLPANAAEQLRQIRHKLPANVQHYLRGGIWRNFMVKYDEINHLHKRMLLVSERVHAMRRGRKRDHALDLLWAAQGNDPYWHGLFGGIYLFNFRVANYSNLLAAELVADLEEEPMRITLADFDCDSYIDILLSDVPLSAIISPALGGAMFELDFYPAQYNVYNVMTRRREAYHTRLVEAAANHTLLTPGSNLPEPETATTPVTRAKENGLEKLLIYDWHRRGSFIDHFISHSTTLDEFYHAQYAEQGDFVAQPYQVLESTTDGDQAVIRLERQGHVWVGDIQHNITIQKTYQFRHNQPTFTINYALWHDANTSLELRFGVESVVGFAGGQDLQNCSLRVNDHAQRLSLNGLREVEAVIRYEADTNLHNITVRTALSRPAFLWQFPLETITLSVAGFERDYQGTIFLHFWNLRLPPNERWQVQLTQTLLQTAARG